MALVFASVIFFLTNLILADSSICLHLCYRPLLAGWVLGDRREAGGVKSKEFEPVVFDVVNRRQIELVNGVIVVEIPFAGSAPADNHPVAACFRIAQGVETSRELGGQMVAEDKFHIIALAFFAPRNKLDTQILFESLDPTVQDRVCFYVHKQNKFSYSNSTA